MCSLKTDPIYNENTVGPQKEPCGTPLQTAAEEDEKLSISTDIDLSCKSDVNQSRTHG